MPTDGKTQAYGFLDQLTTEQLLDLIRADFESSEDGDSALTDRILEVIEKRERNQSTGLFFDVNQAWEDFQTYYIPDGEAHPLYPMRDSDFMNDGETPDKPRHRRPVKRLVPLVAALAVTLSCMIAAQAFGVNVFGALARWSDETFHLAADPDMDTTPESENLRQAVQGAFDNCGITIPAPAWYPDDTKLAKGIDIVENSGNTTVDCEFVCGDSTFRILVQQYLRADLIKSHTAEKDSLDAEEYPSNGRLFYIMSNLSDSRATYSEDRTVFVINGDLSSEDLKQMIDSIGE